MKKVIVTGATSMIGSSLVNLLAEENISVVAISRPNSKNIKHIIDSDNITIIEQDLSDLYSLFSEKSEKFDILFHFGWSGTSKKERNNLFIQNSNIKYTLDAVKLAKKTNCKSFIGAGSQAEYGILTGKISDTTPINPITPYGICKHTAFKLSKILCDKFNIKHNWGRILSVYGPGDNDSTLIMSCINSLINNKKLKTTNGKQLWDYLYSDDCARAFIAIAEKGKKGRDYCIGSGETKSIEEYIQCIKDNITNHHDIIKMGNLKSSNQHDYLCADISKLSKDTGFKPKIDFEEGIKRTIHWFKNR